MAPHSQGVPAGGGITETESAQGPPGAGGCWVQSFAGAGDKIQARTVTTVTPYSGCV